MTLESNLFTSKLWCPMQISLQSLFRQIASNLHRNVLLWKWVYLVSPGFVQFRVRTFEYGEHLELCEMDRMNEICYVCGNIFAKNRANFWFSLLAMALKSGTQLSRWWFAINFFFGSVKCHFRCEIKMI